MLSNDKKYKVEKLTLLERLRSNREAHVKAAQEAEKEWRKQSILALQERLSKARDGHAFNLHFGDLPKPRSYKAEYDKVIGLLEMTSDSIIEITPSDYTCFVLDEWSWKRDFVRSSSVYAGGAALDPDDE